MIQSEFILFYNKLFFVFFKLISSVDTIILWCQYSAIWVDVSGHPVSSAKCVSKDKYKISTLFSTE